MNVELGTRSSFHDIMCELLVVCCSRVCVVWCLLTSRQAALLLKVVQTMAAACQANENMTYYNICLEVI